MGLLTPTSYKNCNVIKENEGYGRVKNPDILPVPSFHLLKNTIKQVEKYTGITMDYLPLSIRTSFGCPMNCNYCGGVQSWNDYHVKSKDYLEREILYFKEILADTGKIVFVADELFTYKNEHIRNVVDVFVKHEIMVQGIFAHSKLFSEETAKLVKCISDTVVFGGENCCNEILVKANKQQTFDSLIDAVEIAKSNGLQVVLEWIVGLPGENIKSASENIAMLYSLIVKKKVDEINTYVFCPYPNTEFEKNSDKYGIELCSNFDEMLEEWYPTYSLKNFSSNQIFMYFLLTQIAITRAHLDKNEIKEDFEPKGCNFDRVKALFERVG